MSNVFTLEPLLTGHMERKKALKIQQIHNLQKRASLHHNKPDTHEPRRHVCPDMLSDQTHCLVRRSCKSQRLHRSVAHRSDTSEIAVTSIRLSMSENGHDRNPLRLLRNSTNLSPCVIVKQWKLCQRASTCANTPSDHSQKYERK